MKKLLSATSTALFVICLLAIAQQAHAGGREESALTRELHRLVGQLPAKVVVDREATATVQFTVSAEGKIQLKSVYSAVPALASHVRERLRDAQLVGAEGVAGKNYRLTLKVADMR
jgi:hypothetical protein